MCKQWRQSFLGWDLRTNQAITAHTNQGCYREALKQKNEWISGVPFENEGKKGKENERKKKGKWKEKKRIWALITEVKTVELLNWKCLAHYVEYLARELQYSDIWFRHTI